jgi:transcriptional regulator with XRE-family HTH domain
MSPEAATNITKLPWTPVVDYGTRLRLIRLDYGERSSQRITQEAFAKLIKVSASSYKQWEAGNNMPADPMDIARRIYKATGANPAWLCDVLIDLTDPDGGGEQEEDQSRCMGRVLDFRSRVEATPLESLPMAA